ncbi:hypothetical protein PYCC9005_000626 [Savitreella phatthalungensis]
MSSKRRSVRDLFRRSSSGNILKVQPHEDEQLRLLQESLDNTRMPLTPTQSPDEAVHQIPTLNVTSELSEELEIEAPKITIASPPASPPASAGADATADTLRSPAPRPPAEARPQVREITPPEQDKPAKQVSKKALRARIEVLRGRLNLRIHRSKERRRVKIARFRERVRIARVARAGGKLPASFSGSRRAINFSLPCRTARCYRDQRPLAMGSMANGDLLTLKALPSDLASSEYSQEGDHDELSDLDEKMRLVALKVDVCLSILSRDVVAEAKRMVQLKSANGSSSDAKRVSKPSLEK